MVPIMRSAPWGCGFLLLESLDFSMCVQLTVLWEAEPSNEGPRVSIDGIEQENTHTHTHTHTHINYTWFKMVASDNLVIQLL